MDEIHLQKDYLQGKPIETVYFGGGTPSLLDAEQITQVFAELAKVHQIADKGEFTLEVNPENLTFDKLQKLRHTPINRLSIGVQSFFDDDLQFMHRGHQVNTSFEVISQAKAVGFQNISIDLIYGLPSMTRQRWSSNLEQFTSLKLPHLSCYELTVEPRTVFFKRKTLGRFTEIDENASAEQFTMLMEHMHDRNYLQYEISNFCLPNWHSRHNSAYWLGKPYLGLGPAAHSFNGWSRQWNVANLKQYLAAITRGIVPFTKEILTPQQQYQEYLFTSLRTMWGCDRQVIEKRFGSHIWADLVPRLQTYQNQGYFIQTGNFWTLTPKGRLVADHLTLQLCTWNLL